MGWCGHTLSTLRNCVDAAITVSVEPPMLLGIAILTVSAFIAIFAVAFWLDAPADGDA
jgi:hypothetical protein